MTHWHELLRLVAASVLLPANSHLSVLPLSCFMQIAASIYDVANTCAASSNVMLPVDAAHLASTFTLIVESAYTGYQAGAVHI